MRTLVEQLGRYAAYHRDRRNVLTHFVGIPMIVLAATILLSRPSIAVGGLTLSPAPAIALILFLYYLRLDWRYGLAMGAALAACLAAAGALAEGGGGARLGWGIGLFVAGWIIQFVGHLFEGRKPAFLDDLMSLAIGPLFVVAEAGFLLGLRKDLQRRISAGGVTAGPRS